MLVSAVTVQNDFLFILDLISDKNHVKSLVPHTRLQHMQIQGNLLLVTTPSRNITLGSSNCPMMLASVRKSRRFFSVAPGFRVLMATVISGRPGMRSLPLHTSPNSPVIIRNKRCLEKKKSIYLISEIWQDKVKQLAICCSAIWHKDMCSGMLLL